MSLKNRRYHGLTHTQLSKRQVANWKRNHCPAGRHLFDECLSNEHYLHCDACGLEVHIAKVVYPAHPH